MLLCLIQMGFIFGFDLTFIYSQSIDSCQLHLHSIFKFSGTDLSWKSFTTWYQLRQLVAALYHLLYDILLIYWEAQYTWGMIRLLLICFLYVPIKFFIYFLFPNIRAIFMSHWEIKRKMCRVSNLTTIASLKLIKMQ